MKVLFVDPPFGGEDIGGKRRYFANVANIIPALGVAYLAAIAEGDGHEARILDCARGLGWDAVRDAGRDFMPDVVAVTATTPAYHNAVESARILREIVPKAVFLIGGPHPTAMPDEVGREPMFDFLVLGEGERTFAEILRHIEGKGPTRPDEICGLAFRREGDLVFTEPRGRIDDLDALPFPARHLLPPLQAYRPTAASCRRLPLAHIMTSRGCPSKCKFCDRMIFGEVYRCRSAANVLAEVEEVVSRYGAREIRFFDDTFTLHRKRVEDICDGLRRRRPKLPWTCLTRVDVVTPDMLRMMREAGCWQVLFGLESGDDRVLKTLGKRNTVEQNRKAVLWAREAGLRVRADFIVGTPAETPETLRNTLDFAKELPLDFAHFNKFIPFPGTEFYRRLIERGYEFDFSKGASVLDHDGLLFVPPAVPAAEYRRFLDEAFRAFYLRPGYLLRRLAGMRTFTELRLNVQGAFSILGM